MHVYCILKVQYFDARKCCQIYLQIFSVDPDKISYRDVKDVVY